MSSRLLHTRDVYDAITGQLNIEREWRSALTAIAEYWKIDFVEALLIYAQNPKANTIATFEQWNKASRYIQRGEKSIAVFRDRTDTKLQYYFDLSQTYGKSIRPKWRVDDSTAQKFVESYNENNEEKITDFTNYLKKELDKSLKKVYNDGRKPFIPSSTKQEDCLKFIGHTALHICAARCGINADTDFGIISTLSPKELVQIGQIATDAAQDVLSEIEHNIRRYQYEQLQTGNSNNQLGLRNERERNNESDTIEQQGTGGSVADGTESSRSAERNESVHVGLREHLGTERNDIRGDSDKGDSEQAETYRRAEEVYRTQQRLYDESVTADGNRYDSGQSSDGADSDVSAKTDNGHSTDGFQTDEGLPHKLTVSDSDSVITFDEQLNIDETEAVSDDDEDTAFVIPDSSDADKQLSFYPSEKSEVRHNVAPAQEPIFIGEVNRFAAIRDEIQRGSGFEDGKFRIDKYYRTQKPSNQEFAIFLKKEYGIGGHSGQGDIGFVSHDSKGIAIEIKDADKRSTALFKWNEIAQITAEMIDSGNYISKEDIDRRIRDANYTMENYPEDSVRYNRAKTILTQYEKIDRAFRISRNVYDTENTRIFTVPGKGSIADVPLVNYDGLVERLADAGLTPKNEEENSIFYHTDNIKWHKFYIPDKFGNKTNSINAADVLSEHEYQIMMNVAAEVVPQLNDEVTVVKDNTADYIAVGYTGIKYELYDNGEMVAETNSFETAQEFVEQSALHSYVELNRFKHDLDTPERADYRAQIKAVYEYEISHEIEQEDRLTGLFEEENVPVALLYEGVTEEQIRQKYEEISSTLEHNEKENTMLSNYNLYHDGEKVGETPFLSSAKEFAEENYRNSFEETKIDIGPVKESDEISADEEDYNDDDEYVLQVGDKIELENGSFKVSDITDRADGSIQYELQDLGCVYPIFRAISKEQLYELGFALVADEQQEQHNAEITNPRHNVAPVDEPTFVKPAPINYRTDNIEYAVGPKAKFRDNISAIKKLLQLEQEKRPATAAEQEMLARYVGWGGLSKAFDEKADDWHNEYTELKALLTESEYKAAFESTLTAYYTDPKIVAEIYGALQRFGFNGGEILDPSMGTGNFFSVLPKEIADNSKLTGIELDSLTGRIAKQLHQKADIKIHGYESTSIDDNKFDVVVGNVPFGNYKPYDKTYADDYLIHDYFFRKSVDKVKPGGIIAFITSKGTLDKFEDGMRRDIAPMVDFIGAVRLPNNSFKAIAGTEVTTDIIFLQKRENEIEYNYNYPEWTKMDRASIRGNYATVNGYFIEHPEMICGDMKSISGRYGQTYECLPTENQDLISDLHNAIGKLEAEFSAAPTVYNSIEETEEKKDNYEDAPVGTKNFTFVHKDSKLYFCENDKLVPYTAKNSKAESRIKGMCDIMTQLEKVINVQLENGGDAELKSEQTKLNKLYDDFVKSNGYLNSTTNSVFSEDVRNPLLYSIEVEDENNDKTYLKADIFSKATIRPYKTPTSAEDAGEALIISLNLKQKVDIEYMAQLCGKDNDEIISELGDKIYLNPAKYYGDKYDGWELAEEYLSGYTKDKLSIATVKAMEYPELFSRNVEALKDNQPTRLSIESIEFSLGTIYIPQKMYSDFMYETFGTGPYHRNKLFPHDYIDINYNTVLNEWQISNKSADARSVAVTEEYGTKRINAYEILEQSLNLKRVEIKDPKKAFDSNGKETIRYVLNKNETLLARERQSKLERAFKDWILADEKRISEIEDIYNDTYNRIKPRTFDGSYIQIKGMSDTMQLRPHQKDVVSRIVNSGTALMAHEVGAGKTAAMAAAGMYLKNIGAANKALYIVPKPIVGQWGKEFLRFFPSANVLVTSENDFSKSNRQRFLSKIATGNYDAIIMSQSQFEKIPLSLERQEDMFNEKIASISNAMAELEQDKGKRFSVKQMAGKRKSLETKLQKLRADFKKDKFITFEELGCDFLFVDEAHNYKNLAIFSKMNNVSGINTSSNSQRAVDMEMKIRYIQEINNGGGVVFATGTPVSNTLSELFVMQHYLQPKLLKEMRIDYFDNWASVFGKTTTSLELKPSGNGFRMKTRFSSFHNLPELCNIFGQVFDIKKTADLDLKLPNVVGGKPNMVVCEKSPEQEIQTQIGMQRAEAIERKLVTPEEDNMLAICTYMTKVALDARINDPSAEDYEFSKVNQCVNSIIDINKRHPGNAQVVFCDSSIPKADGSFSIYDAVKETLIKSGEFKPEEIAFIHDANNDEQRTDMFEKVNNAEIKVIIGSTGKLGTGVNIQNRLVAAHHLDAPYRPADLEQRNGRLVRQGNNNLDVYINYYSTKGTFDNYRWQLLEKKQHFISQVMSGKPASRSCEDIDEATLNFAEMKAATTENPLIAEKLSVDNEVSRLMLLHSEWISRQSKLTFDIQSGYPEKIKSTEENIEKISIDIETLSKNSLSDFTIEIDGKAYTERPDAGKALNIIAAKYASSEDYRNYDKQTVGKYRGFELELSNSGGEVALRLRGAKMYQTQFSWNDLGSIMKIENMAERIPSLKAEEENSLDNYKKQLTAAIKLKEQPFEHTSELNEYLEKQTRINAELEFGGNEEDETVVSDDEEDMER